MRPVAESVGSRGEDHWGGAVHILPDEASSHTPPVCLAPQRQNSISAVEPPDWEGLTAAAAAEPAAGLRRDAADPAEVEGKLASAAPRLRRRGAADT